MPAESAVLQVVLAQACLQALCLVIQIKNGADTLPRLDLLVGIQGGNGFDDFCLCLMDIAFGKFLYPNGGGFQIVDAFFGRTS